MSSAARYLHGLGTSVRGTGETDWFVSGVRTHATETLLGP